MQIPSSSTTEISQFSVQRDARRLRVLSLVHSSGMSLVPARRIMTGPRTILGRDPGPDGFVLVDSQASRKHAELTLDRETETVVVRDLDSRNGLFVDGARIQAATLTDGSVIRVGASLFVYQELSLPVGLDLPGEGQSSRTGLKRALAESRADLVARTKMSILITGPTGAGKEVMAERIHKMSGRSGPLVAVNCSTFGRDLIGSELFGHTRGAFSGAQGSRTGLFAAADGGSLFLDEIAELPLEQQPSLLRALQEGKIRPVGTDREVAVDVRVIAATHRPLAMLKEEGRFRADLYARLAAFVVELAGLANRRDEVLCLFDTFLGQRAPVSTDAAELLLIYGWPANIRELKHAAEHASLFARGEHVEIAHLPDTVRDGARGRGRVGDRSRDDCEPRGFLSLDEDPEFSSKEAVERLLAAHDGNIARVARATGRHRMQIYRWLRRHGLDPARYREDSQH